MTRCRKNAFNVRFRSDVVVGDLLEDNVYTFESETLTKYLLPHKIMFYYLIYVATDSTYF